MAVLEKIRVKFGILISVVIALALLSFAFVHHRSEYHKPGGIIHVIKVSCRKD